MKAGVEERIQGRCSCGRRVVKVLHSRVQTFRVDGTRYAYPERIDADRWSIFRCQSCSQPITESFTAEEVIA